jgi:RNA polymerase sigma-70 factor, ECF subfamily
VDTGIDVMRRQRFESVAEVVYEPLQRYLGRRAAPSDASELLNDTLLVLWRRLDAVPIDDPLPWSYGVARQCLANHRRGDRRRLRLVGRLAAEPERSVPAVDASPSGDTHIELDAAMAALDDDDRELIRLWAWEQLEPREIAVVLDTNANAVSLRLTRVKKKIARSMAGQRQTSGPAGHEGVGHEREPRS